MVGALVGRDLFFWCILNVQTQYTLDDIWSCKVAMGIYALKSLYDGKHLVGQTFQGMAIRWNQHIVLLRGKRHNNSYLQCSFNKHAEDQFAFVVLEELQDEGMLDEREDFWIRQLDSMRGHGGWNLKEGGGHGKYGPALRQRVSEGIRASKAAMESRHARRKSYTLISPTGETVTFVGRRLFCITHDVGGGSFDKLLKGQSFQAGGWRLAQPIVRDVRFILQPLTSSLQRNCPRCGSVIEYVNSWSKNAAEKKSLKCRSCAAHVPRMSRKCKVGFVSVV